MKYENIKFCIVNFDNMIVNSNHIIIIEVIFHNDCCY